MRFTDIKYKKYTFPLNPPIKNSFSTILQKDFLILRAKDNLGNYHYGEVSPLKGFSGENIEECEQNLRELISLKIFTDKIENLKLNLRSLVKFPSLLFGLEQLVLSVEQNKERKNEIYEKNIKLNSLIGIKDFETTISELTKLIKLGYDTIKLKIGRDDFDDDLKVINAVNNKFGSSVELRLDNNGRWDYNEALRNIEKLDKFNIEFIEQPVMRTEELLKLAEVSKINIAADESLSNFGETKNILESGKIKYFVLKPSIRIGIYDAINIINLANKSGVKVIISSAFETVIGKLTLLNLASLTNHSFAHGLSTQNLGEDLFETIQKLNFPLIEISKVSFFPKFEGNIF